jgi:hypothetical protein
MQLLRLRGGASKRRERRHVLHNVVRKRQRLQQAIHVDELLHVLPPNTVDPNCDVRRRHSADISLRFVLHAPLVLHVCARYQRVDKSGVEQRCDKHASCWCENSLQHRTDAVGKVVHSKVAHDALKRLAVLEAGRNLARVAQVHLSERCFSFHRRSSTTTLVLLLLLLLSRPPATCFGQSCFVNVNTHHVLRRRRELADPSDVSAATNCQFEHATCAVGVLGVQGVLHDSVVKRL